MSGAVFVRALLEGDKDSIVRRAITGLREGKISAHAFTVASASLTRIPGAPLAYWISDDVRRLFTRFPPLESGGMTAKIGASTKDDFRWLRLWWEVPSNHILDGLTGPWNDSLDFPSWCFNRSSSGKRWVPFAKGGEWSPYYADLSLVIDWQNDGAEIKRTVSEYRAVRGWSPHWKAELHNPDYYFRPGVTWSRRTQAGLTLRVLPAGSIFADKGPAAFSNRSLDSLLGLMNSAIFAELVSLQMAFGSYEVGVIQRTPVPDLTSDNNASLGDLAMRCVEIKRRLDSANEASHLFTLPGILQIDGPDLAGRAELWCRRAGEATVALEENQRKIDEYALRLYGLAPEEVLGGSERPEVGDAQNGEEEDNIVAPLEGSGLIADLLSYTVGCAFGRWDIRAAEGTSRIPDLPGPFAPLPVYSPNMLLPGAIPIGYPIAVDTDGILADDSDHPDDLVRCVRNALAVLFESKSETSEDHACDLLGIKDLRSYFSNPRQFFNKHIQKYSKSRRKGPIYWLLQSPKGSYSLWLYYHRLDKDTLFKALTLYVEPKIRLERGRLEALTTERASAPFAGKEARQIERAIERQEAFLDDLHGFHDRLQRAADLNLVPDLDDGVVLTMAPLWELVPWKEPKIYWEGLLRGGYEWSSIGKQLREKGLVRA